MTYALSDEAQKDGRLEKLVVVDIAPSNGSIGSEFKAYVAAMKRIDERKLKSRKEAQEAMKETESVCALTFTSGPTQSDARIQQY